VIQNTGTRVEYCPFTRTSEGIQEEKKKSTRQGKKKKEDALNVMDEAIEWNKAILKNEQ
jgi:hypothetical protein